MFMIGLSRWCPSAALGCRCVSSPRIRNPELRIVSLSQMRGNRGFFGVIFGLISMNWSGTVWAMMKRSYRRRGLWFVCLFRRTHMLSRTNWREILCWGRPWSGEGTFWDDTGTSSTVSRLLILFILDVPGLDCKIPGLKADVPTKFSPWGLDLKPTASYPVKQQWSERGMIYFADLFFSSGYRCNFFLTFWIPSI